ncbi:restriction endonuclease subunit S [Coleofasciculus sp. FACHB-64]|uniref:restriction endonuclease subunit S n=1 Tax=Cyanophyceae TaxID=3028117 RepID=UPI0016879C27|nr:restriction endonuclease subunit S [Coleofasciculus sp. FACHB-64]MBD2044131.1 restriction endonuclease subunit S [Coleofasciculus sp. FACHB-64]
MSRFLLDSSHYSATPINHEVDVFSESSGIPQLTGIGLAKYKVALPPLPEQKAIAQALSDIDAAITELDRLITKKCNIKQGTMQQLLTGKKRLPGFSSEWEIKRLGEILKVGHGKSQHDIADENGQFPILATGGEIGRAKTYLYDKPSVLIGRKGTIDVPQYMDSPFWTIDTLFYTEIFNNAFPKFVFYRFNLINWYSYNEASGVPSLNAKTIENIEVYLPSVDEQKAIAQVLTDMDAQIKALEQKRDKHKAIKQGMMQELLTGRTRLV